MTTQLNIERKDAIAILTIDLAPWNIMSMDFIVLIGRYIFTPSFPA